MEEATAVWLTLGDSKIQAYQLTQNNQRLIVFTHRLMADPVGRSKGTAQKFCKTHEQELPPTITAIVPDKPRPVALSSWEAAQAYWQSQAAKGNAQAQALAEAAAVTASSSLHLQVITEASASDTPYPKNIEAALAALPSGESLPGTAEVKALEEGLNLISRWLIEAGLDKTSIAQWKLNCLGKRFPALEVEVGEAQKLLGQHDTSPSGMIVSQVAEKVSEELDRAISPAQVNSALHDLSLQEFAKSGSRERRLTPKGQAYGRAVLVTSRSNAWSGAQIRWFDNVVPLLCDYFLDISPA
ncbi:MAG: hypothetical protein AB4426_19470 [Xenococcaceae cyanobacterium]